MVWQMVFMQGDPSTRAPTYHSNMAADAQAKGETIDSKKAASGVGFNVTHDLVNEYEPTDARDSFSIKFANGPTVKDWFITKYRDTSGTAGKNGYGGNDFPLVRYAEVILLLAVVNISKGGNATAI